MTLEESLPKPYGTNNCYECGKEPSTSDNWWHRFVLIGGVEYSVPICPECDPVTECYWCGAEYDPEKEGCLTKVDDWLTAVSTCEKCKKEKGKE